MAIDRTTELKTVSNGKAWVLTGPLVECTACGFRHRVLPDETFKHCPGCGKKIRKPDEGEK